MIIKGRSRSNGVQLANYLLHSEENEHVSVLEVTGMATDRLPDALREMQEITDSGQKGVKGLYHGVISPQPDYEMTREQWITAADELGRSLKLEHQPRAIVVHEKQGRAHAHVVFQRTDRDTLTLIPDSWNYIAHEKASRALEREWGHEVVPGAHVGPKAKDRERNREQDYKRFQDERPEMSRAERIEIVTDLYHQSDGARSFVSALGSAGFALARGDRRDFLIVDGIGEAFSLARCIKGIKTKQLRAFMDSYKPESLPDLAKARQLVADRAAKDERAGSARDAFAKAAKPAAHEKHGKQESRNTAAKPTEDMTRSNEWDRYSAALAKRVYQSRHIVRSMRERLADRLSTFAHRAAQRFKEWRNRSGTKVGRRDETAPALKDQFAEKVSAKARKAAKVISRTPDKGPDHER